MATEPHWQLHSLARYDHFAATWDRLNDSAGRLPFLRSRFIRQLIPVFAKGDELLCVRGNEEHEVAICIIAPARFGTWQTWQPSQLPLGAWLMGNDQTYMETLESLLRELRRFPLLLSVTQLDPVAYGRPADHGALRTVDYIETGWIEVRPPFDQYWNARGKKLRENMRQQRSRLARDGVQTYLDVLTAPEDVAGAIVDFGRLETAGWKGAAGSAIHANNDQGRFYRAVLEEFCRIGAGRIYRYRFGEKVVAMDLCVESDEMQVVLKTTYDETIKAMSPSTLMRQDAYRSLFDEGRIRRIEFFGRYLEWTSRWTDKRRTLYHVNCYRHGLLPMALSRTAAIRQILRKTKSLQE